jgi:sugar/nucleoside kinase (ribokinase family)
MSRVGIAAGGNWIVDRAKVIDGWPEQETLALILEEHSSNGGCSYNLLKDLRLLDCPFPLFGIGLVGRDSDGQFILDDCRKHAIDTTAIAQTGQAITSYCDVVTDRRTARRTFFHNPGANALLDVDHFPLERCTARIFHLGYLTLLESLDRQRPDGKSGHEILLASAKSRGMLTVADTVSSKTPAFASIITPCLPHLDYLIINEIEAGQLVGKELRGGNSKMEVEEIADAARRIFAGGVSKSVVIHFSQGSVAVTAAGAVPRQGACHVPLSYIKGTAGAGDAFSAGFLLGVHEGWDVRACLELATCSAAVSLGDVGCSAAVKPWKLCLEMGREWGFRSL